MFSALCQCSACVQAAWRLFVLVLTLALPAVVYRALSKHVQPLDFFNAIAEALNGPQTAHDGRAKVTQAVSHL